MPQLAIDGGSPVLPDGVGPRIFIGPEEREAALRVIDRAMEQGGAFDRYGGEEVDAYEREFAEFVGVEHATAVSSGTAAVHTAVAALHLEPGTEVVCSPITDPGAVMPVVMMQCIPVFADTDPRTFNVTPESVERAITDRTGAIVVGHLAGEPADIGPIVETAAARGIPVIEDCAQAHGATYRGSGVGSLGTLACFSLMSGKHHTSGGQGGMIVTNNADLCLEAKRFADRGKPFECDESTNLFMGLNYRMTDLQGAIGRVQLRRVHEFASKRRANAVRLAEAIADLKAVHMGHILPDTEPAHWFVRLRIDTEKLTVDKARFAEACRAEGLPGAATYSALIYPAKWFAERRTVGDSGLPWSASDRDYDYTHCCPNAEKAVADHIIVTWPETYSEDEVDAFAEILRKVETAYLR